MQPSAPLSSRLTSIRKLFQEEYVQMTAFFFGYLAAAQLGLELFTAPAVLSPAAGLALAVLVMKGIRWWPILFLASTLINILNGASIFAILIIPLAQTLQAIVGAYLLQKLGFNPQMRRLKDTLLVMLISVGVSVILPTFGLLGRFLNNQYLGTPYSNLTWGTWWTGVIMSILIVSPLIFCWFARPLPQRDGQDVLEIIGSFTLLLICNFFLFFTTITTFYNISLVYFLLIPLFWIALRVGIRFMTLALFITSIFAVGGAFFGVAAAPAGILGMRLFQLEVFINIIAVIFLILVSLEEERRVALKTLHFHVSDLEEALRKLGLQDRAKNEFIAVLAHELRNPLAPIVSSVEILKLRGTLPRAEAETVEVIDGQIRRMRRLLDDLLDISRISRQKLTLQKEPIDLRTVVTSSLQSVKHFIEERRQMLLRDLPPHEVLIEGDLMRLEQVCINLLNNASKFTPEGGSITVRVAIKSDLRGDFAELSVSDSGIGIEQDLLERVFEPFLQVELGRHSREGLGIGLSLAKTLVEMHGGAISVESKGTGRGSTFAIKLPLRNHAAVSNRTSPFLAPPKLSEEGVRLSNTITYMHTHQKNGPPENSEHRKILVVDDNAAAASGVATLLELKGYVPECAYSGQEAKEKAAHFKPAIVLLDIGLPDMEGYEVAKALRTELNFTGPIIALTGYGQSEDKSKAYDAGFDYHLTKPVGINELESALLGYRDRLKKAT